MPEPDHRGCAAAGISALQRWYTRVAGDPAHAGVVQTTFRRVPRWRGRFVNTFYDGTARKRRRQPVRPAAAKNKSEKGHPGYRGSAAASRAVA